MPTIPRILPPHGLRPPAPRERAAPETARTLARRLGVAEPSLMAYLEATGGAPDGSDRYRGEPARTGEQ
jgi:hypothetical protein